MNYDALFDKMDLTGATLICPVGMFQFREVGERPYFSTEDGPRPATDQEIKGLVEFLNYTPEEEAA